MLIYSGLQAIVAAKQRLAATEEGQGLVEYALILVLVAVVAVVMLAAVGGTVHNVLYRDGVCELGNTLSNSMSACG